MDLFNQAWDYANDFIYLLPEEYPDSDLIISQLFVTSQILELIAENGVEVLDDPDLYDTLYQQISDKIQSNRDNLRDRFQDFISDMPDNLQDQMNQFDNEAQYNIIANAIYDLRENDKDIYDESSYSLYVQKIEPYVIRAMKNEIDDEQENIELNV